jgi:hypothetical protein
MTQEIITTRRGIYGRVNITLPMRAKTTVMDWARKSDMKKSEFLRVALMMGAMQLAHNFQQPNAFERHAEEMDEEEDARQADRPQA